MKKKIRVLLNYILIKTSGRTYYLSRIVFENRLKRVFKKKIINKFLFVLSPNYCGSTLLNQILCTSSNVSVNNAVGGTMEGQKLPEVIHIMNINNRFDEHIDFDWNYIKKQWLKYWDITLPILLEKSPPNLVRAQSISQVFKPAYFIVFYRNPYAHCESLIRRDKISAKDAADFAIKCLKHQKYNIEHLEHILAISYEQLTNEPLKAKKLLSEFLIELADINLDHEFSAHNFKHQKMKVVNLNQEKFSKLTFDELIEINTVFKNNLDILSYFNYSLISK